GGVAPANAIMNTVKKMKTIKRTPIRRAVFGCGDLSAIDDLTFSVHAWRLLRMRISAADIIITSTREIAPQKRTTDIPELSIYCWRVYSAGLSVRLPIPFSGERTLRMSNFRGWESFFTSNDPT